MLILLRPTYVLGDTMGFSFTILGLGHVGSEIALGCLINPSIRVHMSELYLMDIDEARVRGEASDLQQASEILDSACKPRISIAHEIPESDVYVICAGMTNADRSSLYETNRKIIEKYMPEISKNIRNDGAVIMVTNPSHRLAQLALEYVTVVIPTGSLIDNARLRLCKAAGSHEKPDIQSKYLEAKEGKGYTSHAPASEALLRISQWINGFPNGGNFL
jgi:malate/lactate dehydrogenase